MEFVLYSLQTCITDSTIAARRKTWSNPLIALQTTLFVRNVSPNELHAPLIAGFPKVRPHSVKNSDIVPPFLSSLKECHPTNPDPPVISRSLVSTFASG